MIGLWAALLARADEGPPYAGLPEVRLSALGLGAPTAVEGSPELRYPLAGGGYVRLLIYADPVAAETGLQGFLKAAVTVTPVETTPTLPAVDRSFGDGRGALLVRSRNAVLYVHDPSEHAEAEVRGILASMAVRDR